MRLKLGAIYCSMMTSAGDKPLPQMRKRRKTNRSRSGCLTCRQRRQACNEQRPACGNCVTGLRKCEYGVPVLPLRERRKALLPGEQPWALSQAMGAMSLSQNLGRCLSNTIRPISMAFKSDELFHYFFSLEDTFDLSHKGRRRALLSSTMQSDDALRNTILIAGLHYTLNAGNLTFFEPTMLFHKVEAIRLVNEFLEQPGLKYGTCVKHMTTLCLTECVLGNIPTSETHLDGMARFMNIHRPPQRLYQAKPTANEELSDRYFLFTCNFLYGCKSRLQTTLDDEPSLNPGEQPSTNRVQEVMRRWAKQEFRGLETRLEGVGAIPFFFQELPRKTVLSDIDVTSVMDCLMALTESVRLKKEMSSAHLIWFEGAATRLLPAFVATHIESIYGDGNTASTDRERSQLSSSWCGLASASGLYLHSILEVWNAGAPIAPEIHRRMLHILIQDLQSHHYSIKSGYMLASKLWAWKAFVAAFSLEKHMPFDVDDVLGPLEKPLQNLVRDWSLSSRVTQWNSARDSLEEIVWPTSFHANNLAENLWYRCIAG